MLVSLASAAGKLWQVLAGQALIGSLTRKAGRYSGKVSNRCGGEGRRRVNGMPGSASRRWITLATQSEHSSCALSFP